MKKYFSLLVIAGLVFAIAPSFAKAETGARLPDLTREKIGQVEAKRAEFEARATDFRAEAEAKRSEFEARVQEKKADFETRKAEQIAKVEVRKQEAIKKQTSQIVRKLDGFVVRLEENYKKISDRVAKLSEKHDTSELETLLGVARAKIDAAKNKVDDLKTMIVEINVTEKDSFRAAVLAIHKGANEAKEALRAAHGALTEVVKAVKLGQLKEKISSDENPEEENNQD